MRAGNSSQVQPANLPALLGLPSLPPPAPTGPNARVKVSAAKAQESEAMHGTKNICSCGQMSEVMFLSCRL